MFETGSSGGAKVTSARGGAWLAYVAVGLAASVVCWLLLDGSAQALVFVVLGVVAAVAILTGVRVNRPPSARPWYALLAGVTLLVAAGAARSYASPLADLAAFAGHVGVALALALIVHSLVSARGRNSGAMLDAAIPAVGLGVVSFVVLAGPYAGGPALASVAYPLLGALYLAAFAWLVFLPSSRPPSLYLLGAGLAVLAISDALHAAAVAGGTNTPGHTADLGFAVAYTLLGAAALHPAMRMLAEPESPARTGFTARGVVLVAAASLLAPVILTVGYLRGEPVSVLTIVGGCVALFLLSLARLRGFVGAAASARDELDLTVGRERVLGASAAALVAATDHRSISDAAHDTARALVGGPASAAVKVALGPVRSMAVTAASGPETPEEEDGYVFSFEDLPSAVRDELLQGRGVSAGRDGRPGRPAKGAEDFYVPLVIGDELRGMISVNASAPLGQGTREGLESLGDQAAFALERVEQTEDLHRRRSRASFESLVQNASDVVAILDNGGAVRYASPAHEQVLGYDPETMTGRSYFEVSHPDDAERARKFFERILASPGASPTLELRMRHADGSWRHVEMVVNNLLADPDIRGVVTNSRDVTERKRAEEALTYQAFHDPLTDLPNRALITERLGHALSRRPESREGSVAVLFFDLDNFKYVNDSLGHEAGDQLLASIGRRLQASLRPEDTIARLGGDEFVVLLEDVEGASQVIYVAERVVKVFETPFWLGGQEVHTNASIGIAISGPDRDQPADLLRGADIAMYRAKTRGTRYEVFSAGMGAHAVRRFERENAIRRAVDREEFVVFYQPKIDLASGALHGFEALVRWEHPERGLLSPAEFIPIAEQSDLIVRIGRWVLEESCRRARVWQDLYGADAPAVGVNLSARQFRHPKLAELVGAVLEETGLDPDRLLLEIVESAVMQDAELSEATLRELNGLGVRVAIDDFGTGYSSLAYLQRFPLDMLKIDRSFVNELGQNPKDTAIITAVCALGQSLEMQVLAEGIETSEQLEQLRALGCELGQGYYFSRPMPRKEAEEMISQHPSITAKAPPPE